MRNTVIGLSPFLVLGGCTGTRKQAVIEPAAPTAAPRVAAVVPGTLQTQVSAIVSNALPDRAVIEPIIVPVVAAESVQPVHTVHAPSAPQCCQTPRRTEPANTGVVLTSMSWARAAIRPNPSPAGCPILISAC